MAAFEFQIHEFILHAPEKRPTVDQGYPGGTSSLEVENHLAFAHDAQKSEFTLLLIPLAQFRTKLAEMPQESPATLSRLEQLPPELLLVIFEQIRLNTVSDRLPQFTTPFSRTLLPYIRRNLYRRIRIKNYQELAALVQNHANPRITSLVRSLLIGHGHRPESLENAVSESGVGWNSISRRDIFDFFRGAVELEVLKICDPTQLSKLIISRDFALSTLPNVKVLELVVAVEIGETRAAQFKWIGGYESLDTLDVKFVETESGVVEGEEANVESEVGELAIENGADGVGMWDGGRNDDVEDVWEGIDDSEQGSECAEESANSDLAYRNRITTLRMSGALNDPQYVDFIKPFHWLQEAGFFDDGTGEPNLVPLLEAMSCEDLAILSIASDLIRDPADQQRIDTVILRFQLLQSLYIAMVDCSSQLLRNLSTLPSLHTLGINHS